MTTSPSQTENCGIAARYAPPAFTSRDPHFERYFWTTPYGYCNNNPLKYIDPTGMDGVISIKGNQITISANIYLYGAGATKSVLAQMQRDVNTKWGGTFSATSSDGTKFNVAVNIKMALYNNEEKCNPFIIPESWNPFNRDNFIEVSATDNRSYVQGGDEGVWRSQGRNGMTLAEDDPAPHEVGHILGLQDRYKDIKGVSVSDTGWESNIMGNSRMGKVEQRNINGILYNAMKAYNQWIQNPENKGKEFRYEIDPGN